MSATPPDSPPADTGWAGDGLSVSQAAATLGLSVNAVRHRMRRGTLPAVKVNGEWRVRLVENMAPGPAASPRTGVAAATPEDRTEDMPPACPVSAQHQLEVIRDTLLRPLIEQNERQQLALTVQSEALGRLGADLDHARQSAEAAIAEHDQLQAERDELLAVREDLRIRLAELEAARRSSQDTLALTAIEASSAPQTDTDAATAAPGKQRQRRWWLRWFGVDE